MSQPLLLLAQLQLVTSKLPSSEGLRLCRALSTARPTPQRPLPLDLETVGVKQRLFTLLSEATEPVPSADLWDRAQGLGLNSKKFMKRMLGQMRKSGQVVAKPVPGLKQFGFLPTGTHARIKRLDSKRARLPQEN